MLLKPVRYLGLQNHCFVSTYLTMASNVSHATHCAGDLSRRAQRKKNAHQHYMRKHKVDRALKQSEEMNETEYYFENGLRKVYPYYFNFNSYVKGRWLGRTVVDVYMNELNGKSEEFLKDEMERGLIRINGKKVPPDFKLKDGHFIEHIVHRHENPVIGGPIEIIANTPDLVVINKPPSIPCHPCSRYRYNTVTFILGVEYGLKNLRTLYRLDRLTSGVLVLPKTTKLSQKWEKQLMNKEFYKEYVCRVEGEFPEGPVTCDQPIEVLSHTVSLFKVGPAGKPSTTTFTRLSFNGTSSVVKCVPLTGRSHQIRIHLQFLGYPIINDPIYNRAIYGKAKGKDGVIERPVSEIVEDIRNGTNIGRWKLGQNPKYAEFVARKNKSNDLKDKPISTIEVESVANDSPDTSKGNNILENSSVEGEKNGLNEINETIDKGTENISDKCIVTKGSDLAFGDNDSSLSTNDDAERACGKKEESHETITDISVETSDSKSDKVCDKVPDQISTGEVSCNTNDDSNETDGIPCKRIKLETVSEVSAIEVKPQGGKKSNISEPQSDIKEVQKEILKEHEKPNVELLMKPSAPAEFDEDKVTFELNCEECMNLFKDPTPADLVLYLHAVRYKGPDWEFSTPLPEWAEPDWSEK